MGGVTVTGEVDDEDRLTTHNHEINCSGEAKIAKPGDFSYIGGNSSSKVTKGNLAVCYKMQTCELSEDKRYNFYGKDGTTVVAYYHYQVCKLTEEAETEGGDQSTWKTASDSDCE